MTICSVFRRSPRCGAAAVEFAIVAASFIVVLLAVVEFGWQLAVAGALDFGLREATLFCAAGSACDGDQLAAMVVRRGVILDGARLGIRGEAFGFETAGPPTTACTYPPPGERVVAPPLPSELTRFCITYRQPWFTPLGRLWSGGDAFLEHRAQSLVRNEPF